ncbi:MAG: hypothetical protein AAGJ35_16215, partial [Myxococcota bacterium]
MSESGMQTRRDEEALRFAFWARGLEISCMFARMMFIAPERYGIVESVFRDNVLQEAVHRLSEDVQRCVAEPGCEGVFAYFPNIVAESDVRQVIELLGKESSWHLGKVVEEDNTELWEMMRLRV